MKREKKSGGWKQEKNKGLNRGGVEKNQLGPKNTKGGGGGDPGEGGGGKNGPLRAAYRKGTVLGRKRGEGGKTFPYLQAASWGKK